jgi:transposase-like protein
VKPIYTAVNATAARAALDELTERWGQRYGAIIRLWESAWTEFIPFLDYGACRRMRARLVARVIGPEAEKVMWPTDRPAGPVRLWLPGGS